MIATVTIGFIVTVAIVLLNLYVDVVLFQDEKMKINVASYRNLTNFAAITQVLTYKKERTNGINSEHCGTMSVMNEQSTHFD